jgi:hypothetical protein
VLGNVKKIHQDEMKVKPRTMRAEHEQREQENPGSHELACRPAVCTVGFEPEVNEHAVSRAATVVFFVRVVPFLLFQELSGRLGTPLFTPADGSMIRMNDLDQECETYRAH